MSRKIIINGMVIFEPEMKRISSENGIYTLSASAALCFELLIENIGNLVTHNQLYEYAWRRFGMEPTSTSLYQNISTLRKSLSKAGIDSDIIRTMARRGFLLSPLTDIKWSGIENISVDVVNNKTHAIDYSSKEPCSNQQSLIKVKYSKKYLTKRMLNCKYVKYKLLALLVCFIVVLLSFFITNYTNRIFFVSKPFYHNDCSVFPNIDSDLKIYDIYDIMNDLKISCKDKDKEILYFTGYRYSERLSFIFCPSQIGEGSGAMCHSNYYIYNVKK